MLEQLLGLSTSRFLSDYYEKTPLHCRERRDVLGDPFRSELLAWLETSSVPIDRIEIFADGERRDAGVHRYRDVLTAPELADIRALGNSIRLANINRYVQGVGALADRLATAIDAVVDVNCYITPASRFTLRPHWDTHDVIVVQIAGCKQWHLYPAHADTPTLPMSDQASPADLKVGEPAESFTLECGQSLYLPRGTIHSAEAGEEESIHLSFRLLPARWVDLLLHLVNKAARATPSLRASVPADLSAQGEADALRGMVLSLLAYCEHNPSDVMRVLEVRPKRSSTG